MNTSTCPYLGLRDDPDTQVAFPSEINFCQHVRRPAPVDLEYQRSFCLADTYAQCPVFPGYRHPSLPQDAQGNWPLGSSRPLAWLWIAILAAVLVIGGLIGLPWLTHGRPFPDLGLAPPTEVLHPSPSVLTQTPQPLSTGTSTPVYFTPTALAQTTTLASEAPATSDMGTQMPTLVLAPLGLETPIGVSPTLLIHRVLPGESLDLIAGRYHTTVAAIQALNYFLPTPLWADLPLVIPVNETRVAGLPQFQAYLVTTTGVSLKQLADSLGVDSVQLSQYNLLTEDTALTAGQWLLVPRNPK